MKKIMSSIAIIVLNLVGFVAFSQNNDEPEALGLPGDNLNLYAVLDVFQKSKTLEEFEKSINDRDNKINNLDLNNDNEIDYIQVSSEKKGSTFLILLRVSLNRSDKQDVAVIEVDKSKNGEIIVQVIGDEELYGKDYIVEPSQNGTTGGTVNPGYSGGNTTIINNNTTNNYTTNNSDTYRSGTSVSVWPVVLYLFSPLFVPWRSPWYWGYYPSYWRPWRPYYYRTYWGYHRHFYRNYYYRRSPYLRTPYYRQYYYNRRVYSNVVRRNRLNNLYNKTYEGRVYRKPSSPIVRPGFNNRPINTNRPGTNRPVTLPSNRYPSNTTRPGSQSGKYPNVTRPGNTNSRPTTYPSTRPNNGSSTTWPATRPTNNPVSWPSSSASRPASRPITRPATRPSSGSMSRPSGLNRATRGGGRV